MLKVNFNFENILKIINIILLIFPTIFNLNYDFYVYLHYTIFVSLLYFIYTSVKEKKIGNLIIYLFFLILFNPFFKIYFQKEILLLAHFLLSAFLTITFSYKQNVQNVLFRIKLKKQTAQRIGYLLIFISTTCLIIFVLEFYQFIKPLYFVSESLSYENIGIEIQLPPEPPEPPSIQTPSPPEPPSPPNLDFNDSFSYQTIENKIVYSRLYIVALIGLVGSLLSLRKHNKYCR